MAAIRYAVLCAVSLFVFHCSTLPAGRYVLATDPASRYRFQYVLDHATGRWVHREFEIRVDRERELPEVWTDDTAGNRVSVQLFKPETAQSGGIYSAIPRVEGDFRIWRGADVIDKADLQGRTAYGVSVSWPVEGRETKYDPMEVFSLPPLGDTVPEEWSPWVTAASLRPGAFGWLDQVQGNPIDALPKPAHPFEMRWRLVFAEIPGRIP